jgi:FG-GAP-like repeat
MLHKWMMLSRLAYLVGTAVALAAGAGMLLVAVPAAGSGFGSARGTTYPSGGTHPDAIVAADFAADGRADLAVANHDSDNVSVLVADVRGALTQPIGSPFSTGGTGPASLAAQDFNGDGRADVAVAYNVNGDVTVLLGDGRGGFGIVPTSISRFAPVAIAAGDFNGDGTQDLAVSRTGHLVSILIGDGQGRLAVGPTVSTGGVGQGGVAIADFNRDGRADVAVANGSSGDVSVLLGDGRGGLGPAPRSPFPSGGNGPNAVATGDFNGDAKADVAVTNYRTGDVSVLLGNGAGQLAPAAGSPYATGGFHPVSIAAGAIDSDKRPDVAVASSSGDISVLLASRNGALRAANGSPFVSGGFHPTSVALGDVNGDGRNDVAVANSSGDVSVLINKGGVSASNRCSISPRPVTMSRRGFVRIKVTCPTRATGTLSLRAGKGRARLGSKRFRVRRAGHSVTVGVKLSSNGRGLVARRKRLKARVTVTARSRGARASRRTTRTLTINAR